MSYLRDDIKKSMDYLLRNEAVVKTLGEQAFEAAINREPDEERCNEMKEKRNILVKQLGLRAFETVIAALEKDLCERMIQLFQEARGNTRNYESVERGVIGAYLEGAFASYLGVALPQLQIAASVRSDLRNDYCNANEYYETRNTPGPETTTTAARGT